MLCRHSSRLIDREQRATRNTRRDSFGRAIHFASFIWFTGRLHVARRHRDDAGRRPGDERHGARLLFTFRRTMASTIDDNTNRPAAVEDAARQFRR